MKISFLRPSIGGRRGRDAMEPLVFGILAALTPPDVQTALYDERIEPMPLDEPTDLAAITVETFTARRAYQVASVLRTRGVPVVMGGYHPTLLPDEALQFADAVVIGDAEGVWPQIVADARVGQLQRLYRSPQPPSLENAPIDRSIFVGKGYGATKPVQTGRGCPYACDFCSIHAFYGSSVRTRPSAQVTDEITSLGSRRIVIVDDNLFANPQYARELCRALRSRKISWGCQIGIDVAQDPELLALMAESGCIAALIGFESLDQQNLRQMRKSWMLQGPSAREAVRAFHQHGIMIYGSFVFGYDNDTPKVFAETLDFALDAGLFLASFAPLTPMPGTPLLERLRQENRMTCDRWWLDPDYRWGQATFRPARMTTEELTGGCLWIRQRFLRYASIARRFWHAAHTRTPAHALVYLAGNLINRWELKQKNGRPLAPPHPLANSGFAESGLQCPAPAALDTRAMRR